MSDNAPAFYVHRGRDGLTIFTASFIHAEKMRGAGYAMEPLSLFQANLQSRVEPWLLECFGEDIANDTAERNHRFLEESLELVQACGCTQSEAHQLVDYVYGRPVGQQMQEVGGVMVTLAALCLANDLDMHEAGERELARIWPLIDKIRAKQAAKPRHSPLPESSDRWRCARFENGYACMEKQCLDCAAQQRAHEQSTRHLPLPE